MARPVARSLLAAGLWVGRFLPWPRRSRGFASPVARLSLDGASPAWTRGSVPLASLTFAEGLRLFGRQRGLALDDFLGRDGRALSGTWPPFTPTGSPGEGPLRPSSGVTRTGDFDNYHDTGSVFFRLRAQFEKIERSKEAQERRAQHRKRCTSVS